jgi:protein TonB
MSKTTVTAADRLSLAIFLAVVVHALVLFGIGFVVAPKPSRQAPLIEITLAENPQDKAPEKHDYLAQANQDGGGESDKAERPRRAREALTDGEPDGQDVLQAAPAPVPPPQARENPVVTAPRSEHKAPDRPRQTEPEQHQPSAADMINSSRQVARMSAFIEERESFSAKFPSKKRIDARTKQHTAAEYIRLWQEKVEMVGNLNYPDEARRRKLSGRLVVEVTVRPDGNLYEVRVLKPSAHAILDQAALRIIRIGAPYSAVPPEVLEGNQLLVMVRTIEFISGQGFRSVDG